MPHKPTITFQLTAVEKEKLRSIAANFGFFIGTGRWVHTGSVLKLLQAIASGELIISHSQEQNINPKDS